MNEKMGDHIPVPEVQPNPGEGESIDSAKIEVYKDATVLTWDTIGQTAEIVPIPFASGNGWRIPEGSNIYVPDIFGVVNGDQESPVLIKTAAGTFITIAQGRMYAALPRQNKRIFDMNQYFTDTNPTIGDDWQIDRRDGGSPLIIKEVSQVSVILGRKLALPGPENIDIDALPNPKSYSAGYSGDKHRAQQLIDESYCHTSVNLLQ